MSDEQAWLKPDQVNQLRDACYTDRFHEDLQMRNDALVALMYDAGLRPKEAVGLTTEMFDSDDGVLRLPSDVQKQFGTGADPRPKTIELGQDQFTSDTVRTVSKYLQSRWKDSLFVFPSRQDDAMSVRSVRRTVKKIAVEADVQPYLGFESRGEPEDVNGYTPRHSVGYRLLSARDDDTTMYDLRNRLRHRSLHTTEKHYDHFDRV